MTDTPDLPPTPTPTSLPPDTPAVRPRIWQAALLVVASGLIAGGSCATVLGGFSSQGTSSDLWSLLFVLAVPFAAAALALLVFRLWRRRVAESWPSLGQAALMAVAGAVLAVGGCGGWAATMDVTGLMPIAVALGAAFVLGTALVIGAGELFLIAMARLMVAPRR